MIEVKSHYSNISVDRYESAGNKPEGMQEVTPEMWPMLQYSDSRKTGRNERAGIFKTVDEIQARYAYEEARKTPLNQKVVNDKYVKQALVVLKFNNCGIMRHYPRRFTGYYIFPLKPLYDYVKRQEKPGWRKVHGKLLALRKQEYHDAERKHPHMNLWQVSARNQKANDNKTDKVTCMHHIPSMLRYFDAHKIPWWRDGEHSVVGFRNALNWALCRSLSHTKWDEGPFVRRSDELKEHPSSRLYIPAPKCAFR